MTGARRRQKLAATDHFSRDGASSRLSGTWQR